MPPRFVGRRDELDIARRSLAGVADGRGAVLALVGEAGIGKSCLAREIVGIAQASAMEVVWAAAWPGGGAPAYWPWQEAIGTIDADAAATLDPSTIPAEAERFQRFRAVADALWRRAGVRPLVIVLDDAHTMDGDGLLLTRFVARAVPTRPVLLVLTHRNTADVDPATAAALVDIGRDATVCVLEAFDAQEVGELVAALGGEPVDAIIDRVCELTGGNPFLVEQTLQAKLHRGDGDLPAGARSFLDARLALLDPKARTTLEVAALLGAAGTPGEVAAVAGIDSVLLEQYRSAAIAAGMLRPDGSGCFVFIHDLAREAVLSRIEPARLAELHRAVLAMLSTSLSPEAALRRARHALALATVSADDAPDAVAIARASAALLMRHALPERAVGLLHRALDTQEAARLGDAAPLLVELAQALRATGHLADARLRFAEATVAAEAGDVVTFGEAVLGLGGLQARELRDPEEHREYVGRVTDALDRLRADPSPDAARLHAALHFRLVVERNVIAQPALDEIEVALDAIRAAGTPYDVANALTLLHQVMLGPQYAADRVAVADELLEVARSNADELNLLIGMWWRAVDELLLGRDADRRLASLRARADALGMASILFSLDTIDVMRLMRAGELKDAASAAEACLQRGLEAGDPDAGSCYAAHVLALSWYAGNVVELLDIAAQAVASESMPDENPVFVATVAALAAEAGDRDLAARSIARVGPLNALVPTSSWLITMFSLVEAASFLADAELAEVVYASLLPYADLPVLASLGVSCFGSARRPLGLAARVAGRLDDAVAHLEQAVDQNLQLGNRPLTAIARADLAETLLERDAPDDRERAAALLDLALEAAVRMNLDGRVRRLTQLRQSIDTSTPDESARFVRHDDGWDLAGLGERAIVPDTIGMRYIATLLASPGVDVPAAQLAGAEVAAVRHEVLDPAALTSLRRRLRELEEGIDQATLRGDAATAAQLQAELDALVAHTRAAAGLGGRSRQFDGPSERARTAVQKAIRRAITNIAREAPVLGAALHVSILTGYECRFEPGDSAPRRWHVQTDT